MVDTSKPAPNVEPDKSSPLSRSPGLLSPKSPHTPVTPKVQLLKVPLHTAEQGKLMEAIKVATHDEKAEALVVKFIAGGGSVKFVDLDGWTPVHWATRLGLPSTLTTLAKHIPAALLQAMRSYTHNDGWCPIHLAARNESPDMIRLLTWGLGVSPNMKSRSGTTPLHVASEAGLWKNIWALFCAGGRVNTSRRDTETTPLHDAARWGHADACRMLLTRCGAQVDPTDIFGQTPLHSAVRWRGGVNVVRTLVEIGKASVIAPNVDGRNPLHLAAFLGRSDICVVLVMLKAPIDLKDGHGLSPLHLAAREGQIQAVHALIACGASPDLKTRPVNADTHIRSERMPMRTPLLLAALHGHAGVVLELVQFGLADVTWYNETDGTALHIAASKGHCDLMRVLVLRCKANVNQQMMPGGATPLHRAIKATQSEAVRVLVQELKADPKVSGEWVGGIAKIAIR